MDYGGPVLYIAQRLYHAHAHPDHAFVFCHFGHDARRFRVPQFSKHIGASGPYRRLAGTQSLYKFFLSAGADGYERGRGLSGHCGKALHLKVSLIVEHRDQVRHG